MKSKLNKLTTLFLTVFMAVSLFAMTVTPVYAQRSGGIVPCGKKVPAGHPELVGVAPYKACTAADFFGGVYYVVNFLISAAGLVAVLFIFWGGAQLLISRGNAAAVQNAKTTIWNAILGLVLIMLSYMIIGYVAGLVIPGADPLNVLKTFAPGQ